MCQGRGINRGKAIRTLAGISLSCFSWAPRVLTAQPLALIVLSSFHLNKNVDFRVRGRVEK